METMTQTPVSATETDPAAIEAWIKEKIADWVGAGEAVSVHRPIAVYGMDSAETAALAEELEQWLGRTVPLDLVWEWGTTREIACRVAEHFQQETV